MANQALCRPARRAPRGTLPSLTDRQFEAYLLARDTLRRLRTAAPPAPAAPRPGRP